MVYIYLIAYATAYYTDPVFLINLSQSHRYTPLNGGTMVVVSKTRARVCLKKNQNVSRPSEHPSVKGRNVKTFRWNHRLQKPTSSWHLNGFPDGSVFVCRLRYEKPTPLCCTIVCSCFSVAAKAVCLRAVRALRSFVLLL